MPAWTQDQLNAMGALLAGTHDRLDPTPQIQPAYNVNDLYKGILPAAAPTATATANKPYSAGITPSQLAAIHAVPSNSYQFPPVYIPNEPSGYSNWNTGNKDRASGAMLQPLDINYSEPPRVPPAMPRIPSPMEDALIAAGIRPGVPMAQQVAGPAPKPANPGWLQTARQLAQVGFRQGAIQAANKKAPPPLPTVARPILDITVPAGKRPVPPIPMGPNAGAQARNKALPPIPAARRYDAANQSAQLAALQRQAQAQASGTMTPVQSLQSQGMSASQAYALANAQAAARAQANASSPSYSSSNSWFNSVTGR